jgi:hypothetical protein
VPTSENIPWKRLLAEVVVIVLSILMAFGIDAWWDERNERIEEKRILRSLQVEFEANRDEAASVLLVHENGLRYVGNLMHLTEDEILALPDEEVERYVRYFAHPRTFDAVRGSVDTLTSSGKVGILQDGELREALATFVNILEDAKEDREYMFHWAMIVWQEVAKNGGPYWEGTENWSKEECIDMPSESGCYISNSTAFLPIATAQDLLRLRSDIALMGYVKRNHKNSVRYVSEIRRAQRQIDKVLGLVRKSL